MPNRWTHFGIFCVACGLTTSAVATAGSAPTSQPAGPRASATTLPVTEKQAEALACEIARTLSAPDSTFYDQCTDQAAIEAAGDAGLSFVPEWLLHRKRLRIDMSFQWLGLQCKLLQVCYEDNQPVPLLRLSRRGGLSASNYNLVDYYKLHLALRPDGTLRVVDIYRTDTGELASETIHRLALETVVTDPSLIGYKRQLVGKDRDYALHYPEIQDLDRYAITCNEEWSAIKGEAIYNNLPETLKKDRMVMLLHVFTSTGFGRAQFKKALTEFHHAYPNDIGQATRIINSFVILNQYDEALAEIDRLDALVGGDAMLDVERGFAAYHAGNRDEEEKFYRKAVEREPTLLPAWFALVWQSIDEVRYDKTVVLLNESGQRAGLRWDRVSTSHLFDQFRETPQYVNWVKTHPQSTAPEPKPDASNWPNWGN
jgi:tetratricopeptide (TPR) repeat protein